MTAPARPAGVPEGARYFPPAKDFTELAQYMVGRRDRRQHLRVCFPFAHWTIRGPLSNTFRRGLLVRPTRYGDYKVWTFSDEAQQVPGVWAWTLTDERRAGA